MPRQLITIITLVSLLTLFPHALARVGLSTLSPQASAPDKSKNSSCPTCPAAQQKNDPLSRLDRLSTLGRRTQATPFLPIKRSIFDGLSVNFVNTSHGNLAFGVADIYLPGGPTPIGFQRTYVSDRKEDIGLGVGWSFGFSDKISVDGDVAKLSDVSGTLEFRRDPQSQRFVLEPPEPGLHQQFEITDPTTITERASDVTRVYTKMGGAYQLTRITGPRGINVLVSHDAAGRLARVANEPGAWIAFEWEEGRDARLLAVVDSSGRRVSFRQDGRLLRAVVDQTGAEWTYDYTNKALRQASDPMSRVLLRARYDKFGRVTAAGDAFGFTRYDYESRRTIVTDPLGTASVYEQTDLGAIATVTDDEGRRVSILFKGANRLARLTDSIGNEMTFSHDSETGCSASQPTAALTGLSFLARMDGLLPSWKGPSAQT